MARFGRGYPIQPKRLSPVRAREAITQEATVALEIGLDTQILAGGTIQSATVALSIPTTQSVAGERAKVATVSLSVGITTSQIASRVKSTTVSLTVPIRQDSSGGSAGATGLGEQRSWVAHDGSAGYLSATADSASAPGWKVAASSNGDSSSGFGFIYDLTDRTYQENIYKHNDYDKETYGARSQPIIHTIAENRALVAWMQLSNRTDVVPTIQIRIVDISGRAITVVDSATIELGPEFRDLSVAAGDAFAYRSFFSTDGSGTLVGGFEGSNVLPMFGVSYTTDTITVNWSDSWPPLPHPTNPNIGEALVWGLHAFWDDSTGTAIIVSGTDHALRLDPADGSWLEQRWIFDDFPPANPSDPYPNDWNWLYQAAAGKNHFILFGSDENYVSGVLGDTKWRPRNHYAVASFNPLRWIKNNEQFEYDSFDGNNRFWLSLNDFKGGEYSHVANSDGSWTLNGYIDDLDDPYWDMTQAQLNAAWEDQPEEWGCHLHNCFVRVVVDDSGSWQITDLFTQGIYQSEPNGASRYGGIAGEKIGHLINDTYAYFYQSIPHSARYSGGKMYLLDSCNTYPIHGFGYVVDESASNQAAEPERAAYIETPPWDHDGWYVPDYLPSQNYLYSNYNPSHPYWSPPVASGPVVICDIKRYDPGSWSGIRKTGLYVGGPMLHTYSPYTGGTVDWIDYDYPRVWKPDVVWRDSSGVCSWQYAFGQEVGSTLPVVTAHPLASAELAPGKFLMAWCHETYALGGEEHSNDMLLAAVVEYGSEPPPLKMTQRDDGRMGGTQRLGYTPQNGDSQRIGWQAY